MINQNKALRGHLIDFLKRIYPREIDELGIISVFYQYYTDTQIRQALHYLVDKGYVEVKELKHPYRERKILRLYKLTAKGIDLAENTISDDGVIMEEQDG